MKQRKRIMILLTVFVFTVCGCGVTNTAGDTSGGSGSAVSGSSTASGSSTEGKGEKAAKNRGYSGEKNSNSFSVQALSNSTNYYREIKEVDDSAEEDGIIQYTLDGKETSRMISPDGKAPVLEYVDDSGLVYGEYLGENRGVENTAYYYIPVEKGEKGDEPLNLKKRQNLFKAEDDGCSYVDSHYIITFEREGHYIRYDRRTGKKYTDYPFGRNSDLWGAEIVGAAGNQICVVVKREKGDSLYCQNLATMKWTKAVDGKGDYADCITEGNKAVAVYSSDASLEMDKIYCVDAEAGKTSLLLSKGQVTKKVLAEGLIRKGEEPLCFSSHFDNLGCSDGRFYLQCQVGTFRNGVYQARNIILSIGLEGKDLSYEKQLTEYMWSKSAYRHTNWKIPAEPDGWNFRGFDWGSKKSVTYQVNAAECVEIRNGKALIFYEPEEGKVEDGVYDMSTGAFHAFTKEEYPQWYADWGDIVTIWEEIDFSELYKDMDYDKWIYEGRKGE